jgi:hypothetical protein
MVSSPEAAGVNVAVYEVPLPVKLLKAPLVTVTSASPKSLADSERLKAIVMEVSLVVEPLASEAGAEVVIVAVGGVLSAGLTVIVTCDSAESTVPSFKTSLIK